MTTMEDVAQTAGVTRMTLYRHLPAREQLMIQVILRAWAREAAIIEAAMQLHEEPSAKLVAGITMFVTRMVEHPYLLRVARDEAPPGLNLADEKGLLTRTFGEFLRPYVVADAQALRGSVDDTMEWLLRQVLLLVQMAPPGGLGEDEVRRQAETFIVPSVRREHSNA